MWRRCLEGDARCRSLKSSNYMQRSFGERVAMNAPIQGTAADIIKVAMIGVSRRLKEKQMKSRLVLQVHDELLIETYIPELEQVEEILTRRNGTVRQTLRYRF